MRGAGLGVVLVPIFSVIGSLLAEMCIRDRWYDSDELIQRNRPMEFYTLASSSAGNAALVCHENTHLLIDVGISCRRLTQSLAALSLTLDDLSLIHIYRLPEL